MGFLSGSFPAVLLAQRWPIDRVVAGTIFCWGICLMCSAACTDWQGFYLQRFFLGFLEAGVSPIFMLIVGNWYKKREQALRIGVWYSATGYAAAVSPLVNYGLGHITGGRLTSWHYMYIIAGAVTIVWSFIVLAYLPPDPANAKGLNVREKYIAASRVVENNTGTQNQKINGPQVWEAIYDVKFWLLSSTAFLMMIANGPVSSFIPIIISGFGFSQLNSLLLALPAGIVIGTIELVVPYIACRVDDMRAWLIVVCQCGTIAASMLLWLLPRDEKGGLLFACYILASYSGGYAVLMGLQVANTAGYTKRSVTSAGIFIGYCLGQSRHLGSLL
jgi:MFS family permease